MFKRLKNELITFIARTTGYVYGGVKDCGDNYVTYGFVKVFCDAKGNVSDPAGLLENVIFLGFGGNTIVFNKARTWQHWRSEHEND